MILSLEQSGFRNLSDFTLEFSPGVNVISGKNGHGKTNFLEAIHLICQGFSFRSRNVLDAIGWNLDGFLLRGKTKAADENSLRAFQAGKDAIRIKLDGKEFRRGTSLFGSAPVVVFSPEDISLVKGSPEVRRSYLDELLCNIKPQNVELLRRYRRVLQQRNKWLKDNLQGTDRSEGGEDLFAALTEQLVELAVRVWEKRIELCQTIKPYVCSYYMELSNSVESLDFNYKHALPREEFERVLLQKRAAEIASGTTLAGPHKDDLELVLHEHPLRECGSQGQCRSAALALKFAAAYVIENGSGLSPILLLDDVFAELDAQRRSSVARIVRERKNQTVAATPEAEDLPFKADFHFKAENGSINFSTLPLC